MRVHTTSLSLNPRSVSLIIMVCGDLLPSLDGRFECFDVLTPPMCCPFSENDVFRLGTEPFVTPQKHVADATPNLCTPDTFKSPLDFTTVTVEQLGITPESFVKTSSGKRSSWIA